MQLEAIFSLSTLKKSEEIHHSQVKMFLTTRHFKDVCGDRDTAKNPKTLVNIRDNLDFPVWNTEFQLEDQMAHYPGLT